VRMSMFATVAEDVGGADLADVAGVADHVRRRCVAQAVRRQPGHAGPRHQTLEGLVEVARRRITPGRAVLLPCALGGSRTPNLLIRRAPKAQVRACFLVTIDTV
jgi:hypothetical protein